MTEAGENRYDYSKLKGRMREMGFTQENLAKVIGISAASMNLALNNKRWFRQYEITRICIVLNIPTQGICAYFFAHIL